MHKIDTELKLAPYQDPVASVRRKTRAQAQECHVVHRTTFRDCALLFVGFGLSISLECGNIGNGLMANVPIAIHMPITQYEGVLMHKSKADSIRKGKNGKSLGSHFATTSARQMVINGYCFKSDSSIGGVPLSIEDWHGRGGGSLCNHSDNPNAELVRDAVGDGYGIYVVALRQIYAGEFIHVDYGKSFIRSSKSNI